MRELSSCGFANSSSLQNVNSSNSGLKSCNTGFVPGQSDFEFSQLSFSGDVSRDSSAIEGSDSQRVPQKTPGRLLKHVPSADGADPRHQPPVEKSRLLSSGEFLKPGVRKLWHKGIRYASRPEAASAEMMERYIPGYQVRQHKTFQVPVYDFEAGTSRMIDFRIGSVFVEYHPPRFWRQGNRYGDFKDATQYFEYRKQLALKKTPEAKAQLKKEIRQRLTEEYRIKRQALIDGEPDVRGSELVVVSCPQELYDRVITRFGVDIPDRDVFLKEFRRLEREIRTISRDPEKSEEHRRYPRTPD